MSIKKILLISSGCISLGLGILGIFLPLLPTTPFVLLSLFCYSRSSDKLRDWLLNNRYLGKYITEYTKNKGIRLSIKIYALSLMWASMIFCILFVTDMLWLRILLLAIAIGVTIHISTFKTIRKSDKL